MQIKVKIIEKAGYMYSFEPDFSSLQVISVQYLFCNNGYLRGIHESWDSVLYIVMNSWKIFFLTYTVPLQVLSFP